jgi:hypothetical protein
MNTSDIFQKITSKKIIENISKQFGIKVDLKNYDRAQLEDVRNQLRTIQFQHEQSAGMNDLLTNETYQKNQAMLELINTRIKEMLGEDIKKLRDKLDALNEGKPGVKIAKHPRGSKGSTKGDGNLANNAKPYDKITRGDVIAGRLGKDEKGGKSVEEGFDDMMQAVADRNKGTEPGKKSVSKTGHNVDRSKPGVVKATKVAPKEKDTPTKEGVDKCNHTMEGKMCPVHGKDECPKMESVVSEKAESKAQQQAAGIALAAKRSGKDPKKGTASAEMAKMPAKELEKFAKTKHKGLPKKKADESVNTFRRNVKLVNESLTRLINENEEEKAKAITAASDMVNDFTSWMQRVGQYQTKALIELADAIRADFGAAEAETFKQTVSPALSATLETLMAQREVISNAVAVLAGEQAPAVPMGTEPEAGAEPGMETPPVEPAEPDAMNEPAADEFAGSEPASTGREMRESRFYKRIAESHSIISKLAR